MQTQIPLRDLNFGHDAANVVNARVAGRDEGINTLAANIHARGLIEPLIVVENGGRYFVSDGNRRLAALRAIHGENSAEPIECKIRNVDAAGAFEDSLTSAVLTQQLHPVDQYEAFAKLRDNGKTDEEIARHFGMTEREVLRALALGQLSPGVRAAWRAGEIRTEVAKAFTLAVDHAQQDQVLDELRHEAADAAKKTRTQRIAEVSKLLADVEADDVKAKLKLSQDDGGRLVEFVGIEAYEARGGRVTRDLFGTDHKLSDLKLVKKMATEKLSAECKRLKDAGWQFAVTEDSVRGQSWKYGRAEVKAIATEEEQAQLARLQSILEAEGFGRPSWESPPDFAELSSSAQEAFLAKRALETEILLRAYTPALMAKCGCFVSIDNDGLLKVEYGRIKPQQEAAAQAEAKTARQETRKAANKAAKADGKPAPELKELSSALAERLQRQLIGATRDALAVDTAGAHPVMALLVGIVCAQIVPDRPWAMADEVRTRLPALRAALSPEAVNAAIARHFDAEDYFGGAPRSFVIRAIAESFSPDQARRLKDKSKAETAKFAIANVTRTGWLPKELRTPHYRGPGTEHYAVPADHIPVEGSALATVPKAKPKAAARAGTKPDADRRRPAKKAAKPARGASAKRAAAAKKPVAKKSGRRK